MNESTAPQHRETTIEELVRQILAYNRGWKAARQVWGAEDPRSHLLKTGKNTLQVRLLRNCPEQIRLVLDSSGESDIEEPLFSIQLEHLIQLPNGEQRRDAAHLPVRIAEEWLEPAELERLRYPRVKSKERP